MRSSVLFLLCSVGAILFSIAYSAAVIGIDFGAESIKVGLVRHGAQPSTVENEQSSRKTPAAVGFRDPDRFVGASAATMSARYPESIFTHWKYLLGVQYDSSLAQTYDLNFKLARNAERGTVDYVEPGTGKQHSVEEIVTMLLQHMRRHADNQAKQHVKDCIITVPPFFDTLQRQTIVDAATTAGLRVLTLMNENMAAALQYGLSKRDVITTFHEEKKNHNIMIFDMGYSSTTTSVVSYLPKDKDSNALGNIVMKGVSWDKTLGGEELDKRIATRLAEEFKTKHKNIDVRSLPKSWVKLRKEAKKVKEILSANNESPVSVESLVDDIDFRTSLKRSELEQLGSDFIPRIRKTIEEAMGKSGLSNDEIHSVEIIGGGSRVPFIIKVLLDYFNRPEINRSLNSDEAISAAAAFYAAKFSGAFVVKSFDLSDLYPKKTTFVLSPETAAHTLFNYDAATPNKKSISVARTKNFNVILSQADTNSNQEDLYMYELTDVESIIEKFQEDKRSLAVVKNPELPGNYSEVECKVKASFELGLGGLVKLNYASVVYVDYVLKEEAQKNTTNTTIPATNTTVNATETTTENTSETKSETNSESQENTSDNATNNTIVEKIPAKPEKRTRRKEITVKTNYLGKIPTLNKNQTEDIKKILDDWDEVDAQKRRLAKARNDLESKIYELRDRLYDDAWDVVFREEEKTNIGEQLGTMEDWLTFDSDQAAEKDFLEKLKVLEDLSANAYLAHSELKLRPEHISRCRQLINSTQTSIPVFSLMEHITKQEVEDLNSTVVEVETWLNATVAKLEETPVYDQPKIVTTKQIEGNCTVLGRRFSRLFTKPKPKPSPKPKAPPKEKDSNTTSAEATNEKAEKGTEAEAETDGTTPEQTQEDSTSRPADETQPEQQPEQQQEQPDQQQQKQEQEPPHDEL